jgi:hypothetical protein
VSQEHIPAPAFPCPAGFKHIPEGDKIPDGAVCVRKDSEIWRPRSCIGMEGFWVLPDHENWYFRPIAQPPEYTPSLPGSAPATQAPEDGFISVPCPEFYGRPICIRVRDRKLEYAEGTEGDQMPRSSSIEEESLYQTVKDSLTVAPVAPVPMEAGDGELVEALEDAMAGLASEEHPHNLDSSFGDVEKAKGEIKTARQSLLSRLSSLRLEITRVTGERDAARKALEGSVRAIDPDELEARFAALIASNFVVRILCDSKGYDLRGFLDGFAGRPDLYEHVLDKLQIREVTMFADAAALSPSTTKESDHGK